MSAEAKIKAKIIGDATGFDKTLAGAKQGVEKFKNDNLKSMAGMIGGAFAVGAVVAWGKSVLDSAGALSDTSKALGISTDALQALSAAGAGAGMTQDDLITKLGKMRDAQDNVANGDEKMTATMARFGITAEQAVRADTATLLELIAKGAKENGTAFADLNDIFGKESAAKMNDMLTELADGGMQKMIDQYKQLGMVIDQDYIAALDRAGDSLERSQKQVSNFAVRSLGWLSDKWKDFGSIAASGYMAAWDGVFDTWKGEGLKGVAKAHQNFIAGIMDGYKGVRDGELGSGAERKAAERAKQLQASKDIIAKENQVKSLKQNQLTALEKERDKAQAELTKKQGKTAEDVAKAEEGKDIKIDPLNSMAAIGRYAGGRGGSTMYSISAAERSARIQEKIAEIEQKSADELKTLNTKISELNGKIDTLNSEVGGN